MKITYKEGDVCQASEAIIAHGCNAQGVMGSGVAKFVREKWPAAYQKYNYKHQTLGLEMGEVVWYFDGTKYIANCITQDKFGYDSKLYCDYDAIRASLQRVYDYAKNLGLTAVAMPQIGAGRGGGDWNVIAAIIEEVFVDVEPVVYLFKE